MQTGMASLALTTRPSGFLATQSSPSKAIFNLFLVKVHNQNPLSGVTDDMITISDYSKNRRRDSCLGRRM
jgi:hypothetical protein